MIEAAPTTSDRTHNIYTVKVQRMFINAALSLDALRLVYFDGIGWTGDYFAAKKYRLIRDAINENLPEPPSPYPCEIWRHTWNGVALVLGEKGRALDLPQAFAISELGVMPCPSI